MYELDERLSGMRERVRERTHIGCRRSQPISVIEECEAEGLPWIRRTARLTKRMCEAESPIILQDERILFTRTLPATTQVFSPEGWAAIAAHGIHEAGPIGNICAGWGGVMADGLLGRRRFAEIAMERYADDPEAVEFLECAIETIDAILALAARYADEAERLGMTEQASVLRRVPAYTPTSFLEALQFMRIAHSAVWLSGHNHVGLGRFDQYMWPYLKADMDSGRIDEKEALDLLAEFMISLNKDSDLYPGVQQGDNGQSMMLGGVTRSGEDAVNPLTRMVLLASRAVGMIDAKINLRIDSQTDLPLLELASELTRIGLGFPQYSNDETVIPALAAHGYDLEDARDYTVAACWEFIIPGKGMEIVNIGALSFPAAVDTAIRRAAKDGCDYDGLVRHAGVAIKEQVDALLKAYATVTLPPAPYYSVLMDGCIDSGRDLSHGLKYNNFGIHGACSSSGADALAAVKAVVFESGEATLPTVVAALDADWIGYEDLRARMQLAPRVGQNDDAADQCLRKIYDLFADACETIEDNGRGGRVRPGTASAMYYLWLAKGMEGMREPVVGATADGRKKGDAFAANLSPSPTTRARGPLSVLQSFGKIDYARVCNGGPITLELSDSVFRSPESVGKVALLIRSMPLAGCQQMQVNTVNPEKLRDAQIHPERHRNLIVRVWGWSGYFCELDKAFQEHIIARQIHTA